MLTLSDGKHCRQFDPAIVVQNFMPEKMLGNWFTQYESNNTVLSETQKCPVNVIEPWDLSTIKDRPLAKRFDTEDFFGFKLRSGYFIPKVNLPIKLDFNGWHKKDSVMSAIWRSPFISPMLANDYLNTLTLGTDYDHWAIIYHCSDKRVNTVNFQKGATVWIMSREKKFEDMPEDARKALEQKFNDLFQ